MIVAFAGRRIDVEETAHPARFPLDAVPRVQRDVEGVLREQRPGAVIGSAACGADLLVLETARKLNIRCRVVLPFTSAAIFSRSTGVERSR
jgi:hypothetical protein